jgi:hypothetical protein
MKNLKIDGLTLTDKMVTELTIWYKEDNTESFPELFLLYLDQTKDTLIRLMCEENEKYDAAIKESLAGIIYIQDSFKNLLPEK